MNFNRNRFTVFSLIYLIYLAILTLNPFEFSIYWFDMLISSNQVYDIFVDYYLLDMFSNVILFIPFGIILYFSHNIQSSKHSRFYVLIIGFCVSLIVEIAQLFLERTTSIFDVITNASGTLLGFMWTPWFLKFKNIYQGKIQKLKPVWIRISMIFVFFIAIIFVFTRGLSKNVLDYWGSDYPFLLGNEATFDRPWTGNLYHLAVYQKALPPSEVKSIYQDELISKDNRNDKNLLMFYPLNEGKGDTLFDQQSHLHLLGDNIQWTKNGNGIVLKGKNAPVNRKTDFIYQKLRETDEFSVELCMETSDLTQNGPARIVTFSKSPDRRNFTVGQVEDKLEFRVSTPQTGPNGSWICLQSKSVLEKDKKHHIVFTFYRGLERLYVDGIPQHPVIRTDSYYLPRLLGLGRITVSHFALFFLMFFPLSVLVHGLFKNYQWFLTLLICVGFMLILQIVLWICISQPVGWQVILFTIIVSLAGCYTGDLIHSKK